MAETPATVPQAATKAGQMPTGWLARWPAATFVLPIAVFMLVGTLEPQPPEAGTIHDDEAAVVEAQIDEAFASGRLLPQISYRHYPYIYSVKILLTLAAMVLVWPGYRTFPCRLSGISIVVGVVGVVLWIGLCQLQIEPKIIGPIDRFLGGLLPITPAEDEPPTIGLMALVGTGERSAYNPLEQLRDSPAWAYLFLAIRFVGLALIVPVIEEFFLRGFLMRFIMHEKWWEVPFGSVNRLAVVVGTAVPMLMHPGELLAALIWFSLVTWLMIRTRNIWDCVAAHAITNLLLGLYVVASGEWQLM